MIAKSPLIIIPAYNVSAVIGRVLDGLAPWRDNVIIVDDGSLDNTMDIISRKGFNGIKFNTNKGVSFAINAGLKYAAVNGYDKVITMDADGQHDPLFIDEFIYKLESFDYVLGNRFHDIRYIPSNKIASNLFASSLFYLITGIKLPDVSCGFRGFKREILPDLSDSAGYETVYDQLFAFLMHNASYSTVKVSALYSNSVLLCTRVEELLGLLNASLRYCYDNEFRKQLLQIRKNIICRNDFHTEVLDTPFFLFYLKGNNSYQIQTDMKVAHSFYYD